MLRRREFLMAAGAGLTAGSLLPMASVHGAIGRREDRKPKIAFLGTEVRTHSHAQHFLDRHTLGYA